MTAASGSSFDAERTIQQALACPCLDDLKAGPCGGHLVEAFSCFHRSQTTPRGFDCYPAYQAFAVSGGAGAGRSGQDGGREWPPKWGNELVGGCAALGTLPLGRCHRASATEPLPLPPSQGVVFAPDDVRRPA